jgi:anti-sigma B factor antagonist
MKISEHEQNGITIYTLEGRIDSEGSIQLQDTLYAGLEAGKYKIVLEMSQVQYINSSALRTLADVITQTRDKNGDLKLVALPPRVKRVLQIVGFDKFSSIFDDLENALADF